MSSSSGKRFVLIIVALIACIVIAFLIIKHQQPLSVSKNAVTINTGGQPTLSSPKAILHFVAFEDLKCINCQRYNLTLYPKIKSTYIDTKRASYTVVPLSFIHQSKPAGNTALCLYHQKTDYFFDFVHYVYAHQPPEENNWATLSRLLQMASQAAPNADMTALSQCMMSNQYYTQLDNNLSLASDIMTKGVRTPSVYVNGVLISPLNMTQTQKVVSQLTGR